MSDEDKKIEPPKRDSHGRLLPGHHLGRPPGTSTDKIRALIEPHKAALIDRLLAIVNTEGPLADQAAVINAARVLLERVAPKPKETERVHVPGLADAKSLTGKAQAIVEAVAAGEISTEAGEKLIRLVGVLREVIQHDELEARIKALEVAKGLREPRTIVPDDGELA